MFRASARSCQLWEEVEAKHQRALERKEKVMADNIPLALPQSHPLPASISIDNATKKGKGQGWRSAKHSRSTNSSNDRGTDWFLRGFRTTSKGMRDLLSM